MIGNGIRHTTVSVGTGPITLAAVSGHPTYANAFGASGSVMVAYAILADDGGQPGPLIESGVASLNLATLVLQRAPSVTWDGATYSSGAPSPISLGAGTKHVICPPTAETVALVPDWVRRHPNRRPQRAQPVLGGRRGGFALPGSGTGLALGGMGANTAAGTVSTPAISTTSRIAHMARAQFAPTAVANAVAGFRFGEPRFIRGGGPNRGGIELAMRFATVTANSECSAFFGLTSSNAGNLNGVDPGADRLDAFGLCRRFLSNPLLDTNWFFVRRTGSGAAVYEDTNIPFSTTGGDCWDLEIYAPPGGGDITVRATYLPADYSNAFVALDAVYSTTLPASTATLGVQGHLRAGATSFAPVVALMHAYPGSDE